MRFAIGTGNQYAVTAAMQLGGDRALRRCSLVSVFSQRQDIIFVSHLHQGGSQVCNRATGYQPQHSVVVVVQACMHAQPCMLLQQQQQQ